MNSRCGSGVVIAGQQPVGIDTHGGGPGAEGSQITATFGQQLMITLYDLAAVTVYSQAWLAPENQWVFEGLPAEVPTIHGQGSIGPALSVRAHGEDVREFRARSLEARGVRVRDVVRGDVEVGRCGVETAQGNCKWHGLILGLKLLIEMGLPVPRELSCRSRGLG